MGRGSRHVYRGRKNLNERSPEVINASTELCIETGAILEAHKYQAKITHSVCVARDDEHSECKVLTPCGVCQERLFIGVLILKQL